MRFNSHSDEVSCAKVLPDAAPVTEALKCIAWCPDIEDESNAREYIGSSPGEVAEQHAEHVYYEGTQREWFEVRVRATKDDRVREWDVTVTVEVEVSFAATLSFPRPTSAKLVATAPLAEATP